jgi:hypothetical protein
MQLEEAIAQGDWKQALCLEIECRLLMSKVMPKPEDASRN